jgi:excisionase family DNA binding protein
MIFDEGKLLELIRAAVREELRGKVDAPAEYISTAEAARIAGVQQVTIRDWMERGRLKRYHAGRQLRVDRAELLALLSAATPSPRVERGDPAAEALRFLERRHGRKAG